MKKLMTMIAAVATAFGLYAASTDIISGAAFDKTDPSLDVGELTWTTTGLFDANYWSGVEGTMTLTDGDSEKAATERPAAFKTNIHDQFMAVKTTLGNPAFMKVNQAGVKQIGNDLFFDGLVKFTAFDDSDEPTAENAKLAVYLKLNEAETETNLFVRAKLGDVAHDFEISNDVVAPDVDAWYRLTVKAIADIDNAGKVAFMVFVDGKAVSSTEAAIASGLKPEYTQWGADGKLFVSLVQGDGADEITGIGFDGQGAIDDVVFTTEIPFDDAATPAMYKANWSAIKDNIDKVYVDGVEVTDATELAQGFAWRTLPIGNAVIAWEGKGYYLDGSKDVAVTKGADFALVASDAKEAKALFNTTKFAELADAVDYANTNGTLGAVKLLADAVVNNIAITKENTTIDLAGKALTLMAEESGLTGAIILANSETEGYAVITGDCQSVTGTFAQDNYNIRFDQEHNKNFRTGACGIGLTEPEGYEWGEDGDYYVLKEKAKTFTVTVPPLTTGLLIDSITTNNVPVAAPAAGDYTLIVGETFTMTYVADAENGYEFTVQDETGIRDATTTKTIEPPTVALKTFTVTYMVDGQQDSTEPVTWGEKPKAVPTPAPKTGYTGAWDVTDPADVEIKKDTTFTYTYTAIEYTITYDMNGVEASVTNGPTSYTVEDGTVTLPTANDIEIKVVGPTFDCWTNAEGQTVSQFSAAAMGCDLTVYAQWTMGQSEESKVISNVVDDGTVPEGQKENFANNVAKLVLVKGNAEGVATWANKVYENGKIPAEKLAAADANDIAISTTFDLPIMVEPTIDAPAVIAAEEGPAAFAFAIKDGSDPVEIYTLTENVKKLVKYASALAGEGAGFDYATDTEVKIDVNKAKTAITAEFVAGPAAGFMKADFTTIEAE